MPFRSPRRQCPTWTSPFVPGNPDLGTRSPHSAASRRPSALRTMTAWAASPCWPPTRDLRPTAHRDVAGHSSDACRATARARPRSSCEERQGPSRTTPGRAVAPSTRRTPAGRCRAKSPAEARSAGSRHLTHARQSALPWLTRPDRAASGHAARSRCMGSARRDVPPDPCPGRMPPNRVATVAPAKPAQIVAPDQATATSPCPTLTTLHVREHQPTAVI